MQIAAPHYASYLHNQFFHAVPPHIMIHSNIDSFLNHCLLQVAWCYKHLQNKNGELVGYQLGFSIEHKQSYQVGLYVSIQQYFTNKTEAKLILIDKIM